MNYEVLTSPYDMVYSQIIFTLKNDKKERCACWSETWSQRHKEDICM